MVNFKKFFRSRLIRFGLLPLIVYFAIFIFFTYPSIYQFSTHLYGDQQDSLVHVWNIWHVDKTISAHQPLWHTSDLQYPSGTTLLAHTLNLTNSLLGVFFLKFLTIFQTYNLLIILIFVSSGLCAFFLCYHFSESYWPSIIGGFVYAFSGYQMLHIGSHMNLNAIQYIPLFILFLHKLLIDPKKRWAVLAAIFLVLIFYTELYYFLYSSLALFLFISAYAYQKRNISFFKTKDYLIAFGIFFGIIIALTGPYIILFLYQSRIDPFTGAHDAVRFSTDLLAPVMPAFLKNWYATKMKLGEGVGESFIGYAVWGMIIYVLVKRKDLGKRFPLPFLVIFFAFLVLSLGPHLHVVNKDLGAFMPYRFLSKLIPGMSVSGVPVRMMLMTFLAASVIVSVGLAKIMEKGRWRYLVLALIGATIFIEYLPAQTFTPSQAYIDPYVLALKDLPGKEAVFDSRSLFTPLLYQTIHGRPVFGGLVSRIPQSVLIQNRFLEGSFLKGNFNVLCESGFRYLAVNKNVQITGAEPILSSDQTSLYDLKTFSESCRNRF